MSGTNRTTDDGSIQYTDLTKAQQATLRRLRRLEGKPLPPTPGGIILEQMRLGLALGLEFVTKGAFFYTAGSNVADMPQHVTNPKEMFTKKAVSGQGDLPSFQTDLCLTIWIFQRWGEFFTRHWLDGIKHIADTRAFPIQAFFVILYAFVFGFWARADHDYMKLLREFVIRLATVWCHGLACTQYQSILKSHEQRPARVTLREQAKIRQDLEAAEATAKLEAAKARARAEAEAEDDSDDSDEEDDEDDDEGDEAKAIKQEEEEDDDDEEDEAEATKEDEEEVKVSSRDAGGSKGRRRHRQRHGQSEPLLQEKLGTEQSAQGEDIAGDN